MRVLFPAYSGETTVEIRYSLYAMYFLPVNPCSFGSGDTLIEIDIDEDNKPIGTWGAVWLHFYQLIDKLTYLLINHLDGKMVFAESKEEAWAYIFSCGTCFLSIK